MVRGFCVKRKGAVQKVLKLLESDYGSVPQLFYHDGDGDDVLVHGQSDFDYVVKSHRHSSITKKNKLRLVAHFASPSPLPPTQSEEQQIHLKSSASLFQEPVKPTKPPLMGKSTSTPRIQASEAVVKSRKVITEPPPDRRAKTAGTNVKFKEVNIEFDPPSLLDTGNEDSTLKHVKNTKSAAVGNMKNINTKANVSAESLTITSPLRASALSKIRKLHSGEVLQEESFPVESEPTPPEEAASARGISSNSIEFLWQRGEVIGAGSFGQVFSGIDLSSGRHIAIKEVTFGRTKHQRDQALSLQQELTILSKLSHPNIVEYLGGNS